MQLALELEPTVQEKARANQRSGGREKASSKLTKDQRIDCRKQIAAVASVCTANVTKVKHILGSAGAPQLTESLRAGNISIHRAWILSKSSSSEIKDALGFRFFKRRRTKRLENWLAKNAPKSDEVADSVRHLILGFKGLKNTPWMANHWQQLDDLIATFESEL